MRNEKASTEVYLRRFVDPLFDDCLDCGTKTEHRWQAVCEDDANPVRWCHACDKAWVWNAAGAKVGV